MRNIITISVFTIGIFVPEIAFSQDHLNTSLRQSYQYSTSIEDIIVTARRQGENLQRTPVAVTALTGVDLEARRVNNIAALQGNAPNLSISAAAGDPNAAIISLRGQVQPDDLVTLDPAIAIYLDNIYVARSTGALLGLVDVERVEVLRGPQGTLFGRNTTGGAINLISRLPDTGRFEGSITGGAGNYGLRDLTGVVNIPISTDAAALRMVVQRSVHNGYAHNDFLHTDLANDDLWFGRGTLRIAPHGSDWSLTVAGDYTRRHNDGQFSKVYDEVTAPATFVVPACLGNPFCAFALAGDDANNYLGGDFYHNQGEHTAFTHTKTGGVSATLEIDTGVITIKSITGWRFNKLSRTADLDGTPYPLLNSTGIVDQKQFSQELQLAGKAFDDRLTYTAGVYFFRENGRQQSTTEALTSINPFLGDSDGRAINRSISAYGQATYAITPATRMTAGLRYTWDKRQLTANNISISLADGSMACPLDPSVLVPDTFCQAQQHAGFDYLSYTLGVDHQLSGDLFGYAKTSRSSRSGGFNIRAVDSITLQPFDPERVTDYEIGLKADLFSRKLRLNLAAYHSILNNAQRMVSAVISGNLISFVQNAAKAKIDGIEAELTARPTHALTLTASGGILWPKYSHYITPLGEDRSSEPFALVPRQTFTLGARYEVPVGFGALNAAIDYNWRSREVFTASPRAEQGAYGLLNGSLALSMDDKRMTFTLWGQNIANIRYFDRAYNISDSTGISFYLPGTPRTFGGTAQIRF